ncbi:MAG TPA: hypothetical protein VJU84_08665 [Pyrinomonadaceae bacterium]|nr:hypothetical protein [Pyrinomonadaceae bacterium]
MVNLKQAEKHERERQRGWILYLLYCSKPKPLELNALWKLLDTYSQPMAHHSFVEAIDYLRSKGMLQIFPADSKAALDNVQQAKLLQRYLDSPRAKDLGTFVSARLTTAGIDFQDGGSEVTGIEHVE